MSIKGFVGFWGDKLKNKMSKSLCDKYKIAIYNGVSFFSERYTVVFSDEYLVNQGDDSLTIRSGQNSLSFNEMMTAEITLDQQSIKLVRDRWGTRTIYYVQEAGNIYFASDIRFLLELPIENIKDYNTNSLLESATLGYIYKESSTLFRNVKQLSRNSVLTFEDNDFHVQRRMVSANKQRFDSFEEAYSCFENSFEKCVNMAGQIVGKKAYMLSGGMDSSAIAIASSKKNKIDTIAFASGNNTEDVYYSRELAKYLDSKHIVLSFDNYKALAEFPAFLNSIENVEMNGIFSPLGGYAYYLLCREIETLGYDVVFPGEGADEILGGYYWQLTHSFGFVDRLKEKTCGTEVYDRVVGLFPEVEEKELYREIVYYLLQGSALTNYHLSCVEHIAKACNLYNYPIYLMDGIYDVVKDIPMKWLCDGQKTKLILRKYLSNYLDEVGLSGLITRKKLAMPSVVPDEFYKKLISIAEKEANISNNPFKEIIGRSPLNVFMMDVFHKYYTLHPLKKVDIETWLEDLVMIDNGESIIHW